MSPAPAPGAERVRVAFIGATGRSGSTLLSRVLGSLPGVCSVGELSWIWTYGVLRNRECGCGLPFHDCPFWTAVGDRAFGGWEQVDATCANDQRRRLTRNTQVPRLLSGRGRGDRELGEYVERLDPLYHAISSVAGGAQVVDNSKQAVVALIARRAPGVDLSVIHLVRRSHGVAYSWTKHVARSDKQGMEMRRRGSARTASRWVLDNALFELLGKYGHPPRPGPLRGLRGRTSQPRSSGWPASSPSTSPGRTTLRRDRTRSSLASDHSVWGNPMRLRTGPERFARTRRGGSRCRLASAAPSPPSACRGWCATATCAPSRRGRGRPVSTAQRNPRPRRCSATSSAQPLRMQVVVQRVAR